MKDVWAAIAAWVSLKGHDVDALKITRMKGVGMNMVRPL